MAAQSFPPLDIAVIGAGVAGLAAALSADKRYRVGVFAKRPLGIAASGWAQGGIAAALRAGDTFEAHQQDTAAAGAGLCRMDAVKKITAEAPGAIEWLKQQGVPFNRRDDGALSLAREGGHSARRIAHIDDRSGQGVLLALIAQARQRENITLIENVIAVDLITEGGESGEGGAGPGGEKRCRGFYGLNRQSGEVVAYSAGAVLLATGGCGRVYLYSSTPQDATGDGIGMAYRAGCRIGNMEFIQFHPTCLYHPRQPTLLISEAVRGEGAVLVNEKGARFAAAAHAQGELAPRDVVARAIDAEMKKSGADCVYLDCRHKDADFWRWRFPAIVAECAARDIRLPQDLIPVVPAAHYCCGGVVTDLQGQTDLRGLYAAGETADTGLHGANRLASNSLLECVVMGRAAAAAMNAAAAAPEADGGARRTGAALRPWDERRISPAQEEVMLAHNWDELRRLMWNYVGIVRSDERLTRARRRVEWISAEIADFYRRYRVSRDFLELRNLAQCAALIIEGALARRENRGLHYNINCRDKAADAAVAAADDTPRHTFLTRYDFASRRQSRNTHCPFSGRLVVAGGTAVYRGAVVGFCNAACRDKFAQAAAANFADAGADVLAAKESFERLLDD